MEILIVGAGIAGLTLADQLAANGHAVKIVEKSPGERTEGYMMDFFGAGYDAAERMGFLSGLETIHYPIDALNVIRPDGSIKYALQYPALRKILHNRHYNFMRGDLEHLLYERVRNRAEIRFGKSLTSVSQDGPEVYATLSDDTKLRCDLLVGADGIHSTLRRLLFGEAESFIRYMGYYTSAYTFDRSPAFNSLKNTFDTFTFPGRQVSLYPIRGSRIATFFLYSTPKYNDRLTREQALQELNKHFGDLGWLIPDTLKAGDGADDFYFDEVAQVELPQWHKGRVALVGDACGCVSLVAGQGASLAMAGAYTLAHCLAESGNDIQAALESYEKTLKPQVAKIQLSGRKFAKFFMPETRWQLNLRDFSMRASVWPVVRNFVNFQSARLPK